MKQQLRDILGLPVKNSMEYWKKYWVYYVQRLKDDKEMSIALKGPRLVLEELIAEIQYHNNNKRNKEFFRAQIDYWKNADAAFGQLFAQELHELNQNYNDIVKIQNICTLIIEKMNEGAYFDTLLECLRNAIENAKRINPNTKSSINLYTELVVSEFVFHNFSISDLESLPMHMPDIVCEAGGSVVVAPDECMGIKLSEYPNEDDYYNAIGEFIKHRELPKRIEDIRSFFYKGRGDYLVLVTVNGIKGNVDFTINGIHFYSPSVRRYITDDTFNELETDEFAQIRVIAAVPTNDCFPQTASIIALNNLQDVLGVLTTFLDPYMPLSYNDKELVVLKDGKPIVFSLPSIHNKFQNQEWLRKRDYNLAMDVSEIIKHIEDIRKRCSNNSSNSNTYQILSSAIYWYKKGRETENAEDKLLYSWIALEAVLSVEQDISDAITNNSNSSKIDVILRIAEAVIMKTRFYYNWKTLYNNLRISVMLDDNFYDISEEVISRAGLNARAGEKIPRTAFIQNLPMIEKSINDEIKKNEIHNVSTFYKNKKGFNTNKTQLQNDLQMIYHLRNLLVHNAYCPSNIINVYAQKAAYVAGAIICKLQTGYAESSKNISELLVELSDNYNSFLSNLDTEIENIKK